MDERTSERIERLETHIAHLEKQYEELNDVVVEQGRVVRRAGASTSGGGQGAGASSALLLYS